MSLRGSLCILASERKLGSSFVVATPIEKKILHHTEKKNTFASNTVLSMLKSHKVVEVTCQVAQGLITCEL